MIAYHSAQFPAYLYIYSDTDFLDGRAARLTLTSHCSRRSSMNVVDQHPTKKQKKEERCSEKGKGDSPVFSLNRLNPFEMDGHMYEPTCHNARKGPKRKRRLWETQEKKQQNEAGFY